MYFQALGSSATGAGVKWVIFTSCSRICPWTHKRMLPYSLGAAFTSAISGIYVTRVGRYRPVLFFSWAVMTLGFGLMILLNNTSNLCVITLADYGCSMLTLTTRIPRAEKILYPLVAAIGVGCLFQVHACSYILVSIHVLTSRIFRRHWLLFKLRCPSRTWLLARRHSVSSGLFFIF